ncbi:MAG: heterodisulfide reductase-related iron-sulfur binding cluster [Actinomycetota bacterium]|nr:heterodisulfide reductase-related iron-sulfur binding cluster [Actinomycetota bacterium]
MNEAPAATGPTGALGRLPVDDDDLAACVSCGLCLPSCPTYRVTGDESASPRGRIAAMREVHEGAVMDSTFTGFMDLCVQCRAYEVACPSAVPFGRLMEGARHALATETEYQPWWRRAGYAVLGHHRLLLALTAVGAVAQRARLMPPSLVRRLSLPRLPVRQPRLRPSGTDVYLFTGCVMDAWQRTVHAAAQTVIEATGVTVDMPRAGGDCCGALHLHAGLTDQARRLALRVMSSMPGDAAILVDSAGCGAALKDYGHLLGIPDAARFSSRVRDIHEWLAARVEQLPPGRASVTGPVAVQDPCHLRHVQHAHLPVRTVLSRYVELVELDDEGMCCGAGGAYSALHPEMAGPIRDRKLAAIERSGARVVASANPGCSLWLASAGLDVRHPVELIAEAIAAGRSGGFGLGR